MACCVGRWGGALARAGAIGAVAALAGCAKEGPTEFAVSAAEYPAAFAAAREVLREHRFELDRVDARSGVIASRPAVTDGLFSPWDRQQSTAAQEWEDTVNYQRRRVNVRFVRTEGTPAVDRATVRAEGLPPDLLEEPGPLTARVEVVVERLQRPGWRPATQSVRMTSFTSDPALAARGMEPVYAVRLSDDPLLAARLVRAIQAQMRTDAEAAADGAAVAPVDAPTAGAAAEDAAGGDVKPEPAAGR